MPKALCLLSLVASILVMVLFGSELVLGFAGMSDTAILGATSTLMNVGFLIFGGVLAFLSFTTYREQR